jgi:hypothetical protein
MALMTKGKVLLLTILERAGQSWRWMSRSKWRTILSREEAEEAMVWFVLGEEFIDDNSIS